MTNKLEEFLRDEWGIEGYNDDEIRRNWPSYFRILQEVRKGGGDVGEIPLIKVKVAGLKAALEKRVDEVNAAYDEALAKLDAEDSRRGNYRTAVADYHTAFAAAWQDREKFELRYDDLRVIDGKGGKLPVYPAAARTEENVKDARTKLEKDRAAALAPLQAQLAVLSIADDKAVSLRGVSVESLLRTPVPTGLSY